MMSIAPPRRLEAGDPADDSRLTGNVTISIAGEPVALELVVPAHPVTLETLLPILRGLADTIAERGVAAAERDNEEVSCRLGCAACCRQLVPLARTEARSLAALVAAMPAPRRTAVRARFAAAAARLDETGLSEEIAAGAPIRAGTSAAWAQRYFALRLDCPFLEDEACTIHPDRPFACRAYLVTTPAWHCWHPGELPILGVPLSGSMLRAAVQAEGGERWIPLPLALRFAGADADPRPARAAPEHLQAVFAALRA